MSHPRGQESQPGYMDGVCVKISENYKPPPRINNVLPHSWFAQQQQQQLYQKDTTYDFSLENNIKGVMQEVKNIRRTTHENKRQKLDKIKADAARKKDDNVVENEPVVCTCTAPVLPSYSHILTPMPLMATNTSTTSVTDKSPFNFADFEADTSSPFDNMELKTINDIEELAQVLNKDETYNKVYTGSSVYDPQHGSYNNLNGYYSNTPNQYYHHTSGYSSIKPVISDNFKVKVTSTTSSINKALKDACISDETSNEKARRGLDETFELLPKNLQQLSQNVSSMGFPLPRVARVCQALGDDQKRVVEHLLVMTELLDLGFSEKDVSCALIQSNNDRDRALDILIT